MDLSTSILALSENGDLQRIHDKWLANDATVSMSQNNELESDRLQVYSFSGLFLICGVACLITLAIHAGILVHKYCEQRRQVSADSSSRSSRSSFQAFLSFADRREIDTRIASKDKAGGDHSISAASSSSVSTTASC